MRKIWILAAIGTIALAACSRELDLEEKVPEKSNPNAAVFTASTESTVTKTALDASLNVLWQSGDQITIVDGASHVGVYTTSSTTTTGTFTHASGTEADTPDYTAYYPASIYSGGTLTFPAEPAYVADNIAGAPMMATSSTNSLEFKNLGGIIRLNLTTNQAEKKVRNIALSATQGMSGPFTVTNDAAVVSGTAGVTLNCGTEGVAIGTEAVPFHIAVPAGNYTGLSITVTTTTGAFQTFALKSDKTVVVGRSELVTINLSANNILTPAVNTYDLTSGDVTIPAGETATVTGTNANAVLNIGAGATVTLADATLKQIVTQGDATLILSGANSQETEFYGAPLHIADNSTLTIDGTGSLAVDRKLSQDYGCIFGPNASLVVNGGTMVLQSNKSNEGNNYVCPAIYVNNYIQNGGSVEAYGKNINTNADSYAIGLRISNDVTITGGTLYTQGSTGIRGGRNITISGGTVSAIGYEKEYNGSTGMVAGADDRSGKLTITGGTVHAEGNGGAGGQGPGMGRRTTTCGDIIISGGDVTVSSTGGAAAIGSGTNAVAVGCNITITSGITRLVVTKGASAQAPIGRGSASSSVGTITIDDGLQIVSSIDGNTWTIEADTYSPASLSDVKTMVNSSVICSKYSGRYVYSDGSIGTSETNAVGRIAHVSLNAGTNACSSVDGSRILVLALTDLASNVDVAGADAAITGTPVIEGAGQTAWKIPTYLEWVNMGKSLGHGNFRTLTEAVGMDTSTNYWTSTSSNGGYGRYYVYYVSGDIYTFDGVANWYSNFATRTPHPTLRTCFAY